ncbi:MAG TPA: choline dehydrogenase, partial [Bacillota bacterium]|nr:choline dehydrogenase [Bacillota bacterium]
MKRKYDYIIVGAGSAGAILGDRLSADGKHSVLVLEAGRSDYPWDLFIQMPAALMYPAGNPLYDWIYKSDPEPYMHGRRIKHARGKVLGGSSSINGMIYQRGNPMDYERWGKDKGMETWDFAHVLPYFKRLENALDSPNDDMRGHDGPIKLTRGPATNPLFNAFFEAAEEAGHPRTSDVNSYQQEGFGPFDRHIYNGQRLSTSHAYLRPAMHRENLHVETRAFVTKINFEGTRAKGVTFRKGKRELIVEGDEVILAGGAFNTPQLLQLSGVGEAEHLKSLGIDPVVDLPGVGENLQDHLEVYIQYSCLEPVSEQPSLNKLRMPFIGLEWLLKRTGPASTSHFEGGGFIRSNEDVDYPNLMYHFLPLAVRYDGKKADTKHGFQVHVGPMYSDARGRLKIKSKDPKEHPSILFN